MAKIPVGATIVHAYRFTFTRFFDIVKVVWLPLALSLLPTLYIQHVMLADMIASPDAPALGGMLGVFFLVYLFVFVMACMQMEGVTRLALGLLPEPAAFYFQIGKPLWRLAASLLLGVVLMFVLGLLLGIVIGVISAVFMLAGSGMENPPSSLVALSFVIYAVIIYVSFRLMYFIAAIVVAEDRMGLKRSWQLGKGNFWRMIGVTLVVLGPLVLLMIAAMLALILPGFPPMPSTDPAANEAYLKAVEAWQAQMSGRMQAMIYPLLPVTAIYTALLMGLAASAQAYAYRAVTGDDGEA